MIAARHIQHGFSYLFMCVWWMQREACLPGSQMDSVVSLLSETCILVFYDKEGSVLINLHIFQSSAEDKIHILPYCVIWGGLFLLQAFRVILEGLKVFYFFSMRGKKHGRRMFLRPIQKSVPGLQLSAAALTNSRNHPDLPHPISSGEQPKQMLLFKA